MSKSKLDYAIRVKRAFEMYQEASFDTIWNFFNGSYFVVGYFCQSDTSIYKLNEGLSFDGIVCFKPMDDKSWEERDSCMSERGKNPIEAIEKAYKQWKSWKESISEDEFNEHYILSRASRNILG